MRSSWEARTINGVGGVGGAMSEAGPVVYVNWLASESDPLLFTHEYPLFSDAHIVAEVSHGPYQFINTIAIRSPGLVRQALILRWDWYWTFPYPTFSKTDAERYHGGTPGEEIAALASLALGVRFRAGDATREFFPGADPKGRPLGLSRRPIPTFVGVAPRGGWILPHAAEGQHSLELLAPLEKLPALRPDGALSLVRSARSYQNALWVAESEPALAWLLFVSALETAALHWRSEKRAPLDRFQTSKPKLFEYLSPFENGDVVRRVAEEFKDSFGATTNFLDFVLEFKPPAPTVRSSWGMIDWSDESLRNILKIVYDYRSKALHAGKPFPAPMCEPPHSQPGMQAPAERPTGHVSMGGAVWRDEDIPIFLHTFEYIARGALVNWWDSIGVQTATPKRAT
jgi:hypothetical protein